MSDIEKVKKLRDATGASFKDCNSAIKESLKLNIPIIAILDTNSDPEGIDFPIPGNDDARRSIDLYCSLVKETINNAKKNIPEDTKKNVEQKMTTSKSSFSTQKKKN